MNSPSCVVIACNNGLGHARRVVSVIARWKSIRPNLNVRLLADPDITARLVNWPTWTDLRQEPGFEFVAFRTDTTLAALVSGSDAAVSWHRRLPPLRETVVWSDNLPQILALRSDAVLSGSFLWHEVVDAISPGTAFAATSRELLGKYRPLMAGNEYFSTVSVREETNFVPVGLYRYVTAPHVSSPRALLISAGYRDYVDSEISQAIQRLARGACPPGFDRIYVERRFLLAGGPTWIREARMDGDMYSEVAAACIRPGLGKLSDCLVAGARIFAFHEVDQWEMLHNGIVLERLAVGEACHDVRDAIERAIAYQGDAAAQARHAHATKGLRIDGVEATAEMLDAALQARAA